MSAAVAVTPQMCSAVVDVHNDFVVEQGAFQYPVAAAPEGEHLLIRDAGDRLILWVAASGPIHWGVTWDGWVTADGRACSTLSEVEEEMGL